MNSSLRLDWCSHEAAKYAVEHWHYSRTLPPSKSAKLGVWESDRFIGAIVFGVGAVHALGMPYGLSAIQICELVRVALREHVVPVSRMVAIGLGMLRNAYPGLRLVVSYADPSQGHLGGIYQAGGWVYVGTNAGSSYLVRTPDGKLLHARAAIHKYRSCRGFPRVETPKKHKYLMPLDPEMAAQIKPLARPYPKRACVGSVDGNAPAYPAGVGGSTPTPTLQKQTA